MEARTLDQSIQSAPEHMVRPALQRYRAEAWARSILAAPEQQAKPAERPRNRADSTQSPIGKGDDASPSAERRAQRRVLGWDEHSELARPEREALFFLMAARERLEHGQVSAARAVLEAAPPRVLGDPIVAKLRSLLAPPAITAVQNTDSDRTLEYKWLRSEGPKYRGSWIALDGEHLLATAPTLRQLREMLDSLALTKPPLIQRIY